MLGALLVLLNTCEAEADATQAFRSGEYIGEDLELALAARHADQLHAWELEGGALVVVAIGGAVLAYSARRDPVPKV
jgi:hypothetical protein